MTSHHRRRRLLLSLALTLASVCSSMLATTVASHAGTVVYASSFGSSASDDTSALQAALDSTADEVVVDNVGSPWVTGPLFINRDNLTVRFERGVVVNALAGGYPNNTDSLISARNHHDLSFIGYGATLEMNKPEYTDGEWRMGLALYSDSDVSIEGLTIKSTGGDGIYLGDNSANGTGYNSNVTIKNVTLDDNKRNGLSVISVDGLTVDGLKVTQSSGTLPEVGVDFEPNSAGQRLSNITMSNLDVEDNAVGCVDVAMYALDHTSEPVSISVSNLYCDNPSGIKVSGTHQDGPAGSITFDGALVNSSSPSGSGLSVYAKAAYRSRLTFSSTVWQGSDIIPIYLSGTAPADAPEYGGVRFDNDVVLYDVNSRIVLASESATSDGVANLTGDITVVDPHGADVELGPKAHQIHLRVRALQTAPATSVAVSETSSTVQAGQQESFVITRSSTDQSAPLAVRYQMSGTANARDDYDGLSGVAVIPARHSSITVPIDARAGARAPGSSATAMLTLLPDPAYTPPASDSATMTIES